MLPIAEDAETAELCALQIDVFARVGLGTLAHFDRSEIGLFLHHLEFDGQAVAVPSGHERRAETGHGLRFDHKVFEDLVQRRAHVHVAIGEGRSVVQDEGRRVLARFLDAVVDGVLFPRGQLLRFARGQPRFHREIGAREIECLLVILAHGSRAD